MNKPDSLPSYLYRAAQVRAMDRFAIDQEGIAGIELMRRAGEAAFAALRERWPDANTLSVVCGAGNNGGDGYVVARLAMQAGMDVRVYPLAPPESLKGEALMAFQEYQAEGGPVLDFVPADFEGAEVLVDALLGTGLDRDVEGPYADVIRAMNRFRGQVAALDVPSGLNADTGRAMGAAAKADLTVTFMALKQGLFTGDGPENCGEVVFHDLHTPASVRASQQPSARLLPSSCRGLSKRPKGAHKGNFGHVLVVGGAPGFAGAARMAAEAAARVGAGLVSVATKPEQAAVVNINRPELMCHAINTQDELFRLLERVSVVAVGPGLGQSPWARALFTATMDSGLPAVVDADALNLLVNSNRRRDDWVLTPHPGEAARMLQTTTGAVQSDRFAAIAELQQRYGGVVVLKGSGTLVLGPTGKPAVCALGNPGMASGGMGDVLTGVIAGLLAQGLDFAEAAEAGVCLHGAAGDWAASEGGERGLLASDLMPFLRKLANQ